MVSSVLPKIDIEGKALDQDHSNTKGTAEDTQYGDHHGESYRHDAHRYDETL